MACVSCGDIADREPLPAYFGATKKSTNFVSAHHVIFVTFCERNVAEVPDPDVTLCTAKTVRSSCPTAPLLSTFALPSNVHTPSDNAG